MLRDYPSVDTNEIQKKASQANQLSHSKPSNTGHRSSCRRSSSPLSRPQTLPAQAA
jgi:hypothetical protein